MVVVPVATAVTTPSVPIVATEPLVLLQVPPATASLSEAEPGRQIVDVPDIAAGVAGSGLTVILNVEAVLPQLLEMV